MLPCNPSALAGPLRKKITAYLRANYDLGSLKDADRHLSHAASLEFGKAYLPNKMAVVHAADLMHSAEPGDRRDASFVQVGSSPLCITDDGRAISHYLVSQFQQIIRSREGNPPRLVKKTAYGQVLRFVTLTLSAPFPVLDDDGSLHLVLAFIRPASLTGRNTFGQPMFSASTAPIIVDVSAITDVVGRTRDVSGDWVLVQRTGAAIKHDLPESHPTIDTT